MNGEIREYNKTLEIEPILLVTHAKLINEAFKVRSEHLQATVKSRDMQCIFITGSSGAGKTTLAKMIAEKHGLSYFISSGSNDILDGYMQQPCVIIDDARPNVMSLSDFLKMLDPFTQSTIKSRYKNKFLQCDLIILTSVLDIDTFYKNVFSEHEEPITQLKRRCGTYIKMDRNTIEISLWDNKALCYTEPTRYKNDVIGKYLPTANKTKEDVKNHVSTLIPFLELKEDDGFESIAVAEQLTLPFDVRKECDIYVSSKQRKKM